MARQADIISLLSSALVAGYAFSRSCSAEQMSAMSFLCPGMLRGVREDAPDVWMCKPSMHRSLAAAIDLDVQSFAAQLTAE
eukprot:4522173-Ditylum_brightwellii.AAC.1